MTDNSEFSAMLGDGACQAIPAELLEAFCKGQVAVFAGAGVSAEDGKGLKQKLAEYVANETSCSAEDNAFPDRMELLASQPNGRVGLVKLIKERIDNITSFAELRYLATRFHRELATLHPVDTIVTTNWDMFFEEDCGASPFVFAEDMAYWDVPERRVLKIHGTINSYGSIVATTSQYRESRARLQTSIIGSILKLIVCTKTIVYVGYSANDSDFLFLHDFVRGQIKDLQSQPYVVTPHPTSEELQSFESLGLEPIIGDGVTFIQHVKSHAQETQHHLPDSFYDDVEAMLCHVQAAHGQLYDELDMFEHPEIIICACYQDGLMHALHRILTLRKTGMHSCRRRNYNVHESYADLQKRFVREERYDDVAYVEGYKSAFFYGAVYELPDVDAVPSVFFTLGYNYPVDTFERYKTLLKDIPNMHRGAYAWAKKSVQDLEDCRGEGLVFHHRCRL